MPPPTHIVGALSLAVLSLAFSTPAEALDWNWTFTQTDPEGLNAGNGSGTFTTEDTPNNGIFLITAMFESFQNLRNIGALLPPEPFRTMITL
ncbi:MAG: hypothetical protein ACK5CA_00695 [Cyanobacteriota bacterium]